MAYFIVLIVFAGCAFADVTFTAFRTTLSYQRCSMKTLYLMMALHEVILLTELACLLAQIASTCLVAAVMLKELMVLLSPPIALWIIRAFLAAFTMVQKNVLIPRSGSARAWTKPGYAVVAVLDILTCPLFALACIYVLGYLSDKTLYVPYHRRRWRHLQQRRLAQCLKNNVEGKVSSRKSVDVVGVPGDSSGHIIGREVLPPHSLLLDACGVSQSLNRPQVASRVFGSSSAASLHDGMPSLSPPHPGGDRGQQRGSSKDGSMAGLSATQPGWAAQQRRASLFTANLPPLQLKRRFTLGNSGGDASLDHFAAALIERGFQVNTADSATTVDNGSFLSNPGLSPTHANVAAQRRRSSLIQALTAAQPSRRESVTSATGVAAALPSPTRRGSHTAPTGMGRRPSAVSLFGIDSSTGNVVPLSGPAAAEKMDADAEAAGEPFVPPNFCFNAFDGPPMRSPLKCSPSVASKASSPLRRKSGTAFGGSTTNRGGARVSFASPSHGILESSASPLTPSSQAKRRRSFTPPLRPEALRQPISVPPGQWSGDRRVQMATLPAPSSSDGSPSPVMLRHQQTTIFEEDTQDAAEKKTKYNPLSMD